MAEPVKKPSGPKPAPAEKKKGDQKQKPNKRGK